MDILAPGQSANDRDVDAVTVDHRDFYGFGDFSWDALWTYRRIKGSGVPSAGQSSLQNWILGNDYPFGYLFKGKAATAAEVSDWQGGVNTDVLAGAERHALGWYKTYRDRAPEAFQGKIALHRTMLGTSHGLSKVPYVRDTRRSIGLDDFVIKASDLFPREQNGLSREGTKFADRIGMGAYAVDLHPLSADRGCVYPNLGEKTLPFYLPLRALTNRSVGNLLVAGKTMAQTFSANAATRVHPIEASSGIGAGAAAAVMVKSNLTTTRELSSKSRHVQELARRHGPVDWSF